MTELENKRKALEVQADEVKSNISLEMDDLKKIAKERGNQILIAGGIIAGSYLIYSLFSGNNQTKKEDQREKNEGSFIGSALKSYLVAIALSMAKDKLVDYLKNLEDESLSKEQ
jgi:hypothetical protein